MCRFFLLLLSSLTGLLAQRGSLPLFRLYTAYESEPPELVRNAMRQEIESIFDPIGWQIAWRSLDGDRDSEMSVTLAVVHFVGTCDARDLPVESGGPMILGSTDVENGHVIPFSNVDCGAVGALLAPILTSGDTEVRRQKFGRAVGRVSGMEGYPTPEVIIFVNASRKIVGVGRSGENDWLGYVVGAPGTVTAYAVLPNVGSLCAIGTRDLRQ